MMPVRAPVRSVPASSAQCEETCVEPTRPPARDRQVVVYIVGAGRSGSTLLERALGAFPGHVNVGELVGLFHRTVTEDERCGCGAAFSACPFWREVGAQALGGWDPERVAELAGLKDRVARQRHLYRLVVPRLASRQQARDLARYGEIHERLYRVAAAQVGAAVVVDASKGPAPALALRHAPGLDVRVLHLVRDVRGVAYSWSKPDVARPHATRDAHQHMASFSVARTAARWSRVEVEALAMTRLARHSATVRYEDLVADPGPTLIRALRELGLPAPPSVDHVRGQVITLGPSHGIGGNPSRFQVGEVRLSADESWRCRLGRRDRALTTALGLPGLLGHGYPIG